MRTVTLVTALLGWCCTSSYFCCNALIVPLSAAAPAQSLAGVTLPRVARNGDNSDVEEIDLGAALSSTVDTGRTMLILGTHPADFNTVEYMQRVRAYWPQLKEKGVDRCVMVVNGEIKACARVAELVDLPDGVELCADPVGEAGRKFGVSRGFRPDDSGIPPVLKTTIVGLGFGPPWGTLPAVLTGYIGNPGGQRDWIEEALKQGQLAGRWPAVLDLDPENDDAIVGNRFDDFPLLGSWGRRPFELATLRLQNLVGIQIGHWDELKPVDDRCLTQLGGCAVVGPGGQPIFSWVDRGLCDVPDMQDILNAL